jgi:cyclohexanecarboxylate-CoA ligase/acyl-CoA synthetase
LQWPNSPELFIAFLAISALSVVTQTMHMPYREAELHFLLNHSKAKCFIGLVDTKDYTPVKESVASSKLIRAMFCTI